MKSKLVPAFKSLKAVVKKGKLELWVDKKRVISEFEDEAIEKRICDEDRLKNIYIGGVTLDEDGFPAIVEVVIISKFPLITKDGVEDFAQEISVKGFHHTKLTSEDEEALEVIFEALRKEGVEPEPYKEGWSKWELENPLPEDVLYSGNLDILESNDSGEFDIPNL